MTIKHLVIGGGGPGGFINYGVIKAANLKKIWSYNNLESINATSIGTWIGLSILIGLKWEWIDDYLIKRPWQELFNLSKLNTKDYFTLFKEKGLYNKDKLIQIFEPLLKTVDLTIDTNLRELYEKYKIEFHCYTTNINTSLENQLIDLNYKSHPETLVIDAIYMSSALPFLFQPYNSNNNCFIDGGLLANVPIDKCLERKDVKAKEILATSYKRSCELDFVKENTSFLSYLLALFKLFSWDLVRLNENNQSDEVLLINGECKERNLGSYDFWIHWINKEEDRELLIKSGINSFNEYFEDNKEKIIEFISENLNRDKNLISTYKFKTKILKRSLSF